MSTWPTAATLQAEEILKEAQRSDPDRLAIRTKLLEVYAKRADLKTFETQARQLQGLTNGHGEDWTKAQELGRQIDPTNPLYTEGGEYAIVDTDPMPLHPLGDEPEEVHADAPAGRNRPTAMRGFSSTDLPIDFDQDGPPTVQPTPAPVQPVAHTEPMTMDRPTPRACRTSPVAPRTCRSKSAISTSSRPMWSKCRRSRPSRHPRRPVRRVRSGGQRAVARLRLRRPVARPGQVRAACRRGPTTTPLPDLDMDSTHGDSEPMARKIELADEFRRIGDHEGARELLEEVVSKADGPLKSRAQTMLDALG